MKIKGQGTSDKSELSQSGEASDEFCRHGYPDRVDQIYMDRADYGRSRFRTDGPDNQRKARRLKTEERSDHSPSTE